MTFLETAFYVGFVPLLAACIGGGITSAATLMATKRNHQNNLDLWEKNKKLSEKILITSLLSELSELKKLLVREFEEKLVKDKHDKFLWVFPDGTDYFTIFNTSAGQLGKITDDNIRSKFIAIYIELKFFYDSLKTNSAIIEERRKINLILLEARNVSQTRIELPNTLNFIDQRLSASKNENLLPSYNRIFDLLGDIEKIAK